MEITDNPNPTHWLADLLKQRYGQKNEGRILRTPVGFDFNREPFDPSSYYKQIGTFKGISRAATDVVNQMTLNRVEREQAAESESLKGALSNLSYEPQWNASKKYGLRKVTSNVSKAADYFGSKYGIKSVGGWRAHGSVPGSDHPKGRALDFMTSNKKRGDALASDVIKNYRKWKVTYVIWNRYIWTPGRGWKRYSGPSDHTNHVHVSFYA